MGHHTEFVSQGRQTRLVEAPAALWASRLGLHRFQGAAWTALTPGIAGAFTHTDSSALNCCVGTAVDP